MDNIIYSTHDIMNNIKENTEEIIDNIKDNSKQLFHNPSEFFFSVFKSICKEIYDLHVCITRADF